MTHLRDASERDTNILYTMPIPLFYLYKKIMVFLAKQQKKELALVVTKRDKNWLFYISDINGKSIHRIIVYSAHLSHPMEGKGFNFFSTSGLEKKEQETRIKQILHNIQKSADFNYFERILTVKEESDICASPAQ